ncbi:Polynucleotide [Aspergillus sp. HF37]|nr:Polynucleotide [Aspergillus sp. HF37]
MAGAQGTKRPASPAQPISPPPLKRKVESTVNNKSVATFFTPTSQKKPDQLSWNVIKNSLVVGRYTPGPDQRRNTAKRRIAAFDLDSTLVSTASGNTFPRGPADWKWWHASVPSRVKQLNSDGYQVVVLSNQKKISLQKDMKGGRSDSKSLSNFKERVAAILSQLDIPMGVYAATLDDEYRKPRMGMWSEFLEDYDLDVSGVDLPGSIFVGDAAGRPRDHSQVDLGFAANIGVPFQTPEEFFLNADPEPATRFDPRSYLDLEKDPASTPFTRRNPLELVIFCGSPGSGKSSFYWNTLEPLGYERVNQDILKSRPKCLKVAKDHLTAGRSVVVDNTNADPETRSHWTDLAKETKVPIRCIYFPASPELCRHNNAVRAANRDLNPESRAIVPGIAFGDFARRFREPEVGEGFEDVVRVEFRFRGDDEARRVWGQYWI